MNSGNENIWKFAIDVGGTFTDCVATEPSGQMRWGKVLSSTITKGTVSKLISPISFADVSRVDYKSGFWDGYQIKLFDAGGNVIGTTFVQRFDGEQAVFHLVDEVLWPNQGAIHYELAHQQTAPMLAIRTLVGLGLGDSLPPMNVRLGTTRGTNALLTRSGSPTALVTTKGFGDLLEIGEQNRPELFKLNVNKRSQLYQQVLEIDERVLSDGTIQTSPNESVVRRDLIALHESGIESIAVCLLHGYKYSDHEELVGAIAQTVGFKEISLSCQTAPLIKMVPRGETTVLDAYLNPVLRSYFLDFAKHLQPQSRLRLMTSSGGLVTMDRFSGKDSLLSGPAGGVGSGFDHQHRIWHARGMQHH